MGLCGHNLKEKLECSNSIHEGKNWHQIRISRSGKRKRFVELLQIWRSEEIFFAQENLAACVVDGMHTIKTWTGLMKWNTYQGHEFEKPFTIVLFLRRRPEVCCLCLVTAAEMSPYSLHVFWSLGPLGKICLLQKWLPLRAVKAMVIFHEYCDCWCLYSCDYVSSENNI